MKRRASAECTWRLANIERNLDHHAAFTIFILGGIEYSKTPYALIVRTCFSIPWERVSQHRQEAFLAVARIQHCVPAVSAPKVTPARMVSQHACLDGLKALGELYDEDVDFYDNRGAGRREGQRGER